ncbi:MAG: hypothetical protein GY774_01270 [Planctomycetes bacterium]|nr:hypothetical protein [Planctomycetota bacterium]
MWEEEQDFEILGEVDAYDMNDESAGDFIYSELDPSVDENENSDVFDYEADFYNDEEDE